MRLEQDPIHRHKDVLAHTIAVVENVRAEAKAHFDFRRTRLAALFHDVGKPKTRAFAKGKGVTFHHHEVVGAADDARANDALRYSNDDVEADQSPGRAAPAVPHLPHGLDRLAPCAATCATPADLLEELNVLTRCDCTTRNEKKAAALSKRMDELEARIVELNVAEGAERDSSRARRPRGDGSPRHPARAVGGGGAGLPARAAARRGRSRRGRSGSPARRLVVGAFRELSGPQVTPRPPTARRRDGRPTQPPR